MTATELHVQMEQLHRQTLEQVKVFTSLCEESPAHAEAAWVALRTSVSELMLCCMRYGSELHHELMLTTFTVPKEQDR